MSLAGERVEHEGIVGEVTSDTIVVKIVSTSACASCQVKGSCSMSESEDKIVKVPNTGQAFFVGERVNLVMSSKTGLKSVLIAYVFPVVLLLASLLFFSQLGWSEAVSALLTIFLIALYYIFLYLMKRVLEKKFVVQIEKF